MLKIHSGLAQLLIVGSAGSRAVGVDALVTFLKHKEKGLPPLIVRAPLKLPAAHFTLLNATIPSLRLHS